MAMFKGVDLSSVVIFDEQTEKLWSGNPRCKELFGNKFNRFKYHLGTDNLIYNSRFPEEIYRLVTVSNWSSNDWVCAFEIAGIENQNETIQNKKSYFAPNLGLTTVEQDDEETAELKEIFLAELLKSNGMIAVACRTSRVSQSEVKNWMKKDFRFLERMNDLKQEIVDKVEGSMIKTAQLGDFKAQKYFLDTHAKDRGYGDDNSKKDEGNEEIDLSLLTFQEQEMLHSLLLKAKPQPKMIG